MPNIIHIGLRIPSVHPANINQLQAFVLEAETLGFHSIWVGDHVFHRGDVLDPLPLLGWISALTSKIRLGTSVLLGAYRNPILLAKSTASLDYISNGRLTIGMSLGGTEVEFQSIGVPMKQRASRLRENVQILRSLWSTESACYHGRFFEINEAQINPKPVQRPTIPIWFGGHSEPSLRRMVELADGWIGSASGMNAAEFCSGVERINKYAIEAGRDPSSLDFAKLIQVSVDGDREKALRLAYDHWKSYYGPNYDVERTLVHGNLSDVVSGLSNYLQANVSEITLILEPSTLELDQLHLLRDVAEKLAN